MSTTNQTPWNHSGSNRPFPELVLGLPNKIGYQLVKEEDILYCKAEGNYSKIYFLNGQDVLISRKLKEIASSIKNSWFLRVHQSYIVNMNYARQYIRRSGGQLVMEDSTVIPISKSQKEVVLSFFKRI